MTLTIEFDDQTQARLAAEAKREGLAEPELVVKLVQVALSNQEDEERAKVSAENQSTLDLFAKWREEDANMTPEEIAEENRIWEEFQAGINQSRKEQGMRLL